MASDLRVWGCVYLLFVWPGVLNSVGLRISFVLFLFGCWVVWRFICVELLVVCCIVIVA